jgi:hypothetical protein
MRLIPALHFIFLILSSLLWYSTTQSVEDLNVMFARVEEEIQRNVTDGSAKIKQHVDSILFAKVSLLAEQIFGTVRYPSQLNLHR